MRCELLFLLVASLSLLSGCLSPVTPLPIQQSKTELTPSTARQRDVNTVVPITYEDLDLPMEPDSVFADWMLTQRVRDLDGTRVRIGGFMCAGSIFTQRNIKNFMLLREKECPYGPGGEAHHVIAVELKEVVTHYTTDLVTLEGILRVRPFTGPNGKTWAVYHLEASVVE